MIVFEGPDNAGKSTLANVLAKKHKFFVQGSEGPPKPGESINDRIRRYFDLQSRHPRLLFDRHPCISQPIYSMLAGNPQSVEQELLDKFYSLKPTIVYCDPGDRGMEGHVEKPENDTAEHIKGVNEHYEELLGAYRRWALERATFIYRISDGGHSASRLLCAIIAHHEVSKMKVRSAFDG